MSEAAWAVGPEALLALSGGDAASSKNALLVAKSRLERLMARA